MFCNNCGNELSDGAEFCTNCGAKQIEENKVNQEMKVQETQRPIPPPQSTQKTPMKSTYTGEDPELITVKDYILMMILFAIPIVGLVFMFIWGFGSDTPINKKNYARAMLIMLAIGIVLSILLSVTIGAFTASIINNMYY